MNRAELVIVGAGPGGMAAALAAVEAGLRPVVVDDNPRPGGQIYRAPAGGLDRTAPLRVGPSWRDGGRLKELFQAQAARMEYLRPVNVWGIFSDKTLALSDGQKSFRLGFEKLIIAPGAYDRPVPFPGWTLPGVMTAGAAQRLVKTLGVLPGQRIVLAGSGPLQIALAAQILKLGGRIEALAEAGRTPLAPALLTVLPRNLPLVGELLGYLKTLAVHRVKIQTGLMISRTLGRDGLEAVSLARVDRAWRPRDHRRLTLAADTLCLGYGLTPSVELTQLAGCRHLRSPELGGLVPERDVWLRTSVPGIFAVGDGAGVAGAKVALIEGRLAALAAALELGRLDPTSFRSQARPLLFKKAALLKLKKVLDAQTAPGPGLYELADEETVICRCEGVTLGELEQASAKGGRNTNDLKRLTRCGMGRCQGRICGPILQNLGLGDQSPLHRRPPLRPVPLGVLAQADVEAEDKPGVDHAA